MKHLILPLALAVAASAVAEDEWVSVGANRTVAPAQPETLPPSSSSSVTPVATLAQPAAESDAGNDLLSELLFQVEQMQQEIAMLRSQVETQDKQLQTMKQEQQARYLDLDRRVASLVRQPVVQKPATDTPVVAATPQLSAADAYKAAMTLVREKKFVEANQAFADFVTHYPDDALAANAWYWNGEVYLVQSKLPEAEKAFTQVVEHHGDHQKAPDATYKLGVTLHKQGKTEQARNWLNKVIERYTGKADSTVRLAKSYLEKMPAGR